jgi:hypothetical protein
LTNTSTPGLNDAVRWRIDVDRAQRNRTPLERLADLDEADHAAHERAIADGRVPVTTGS